MTSFEEIIQEDDKLPILKITSSEFKAVISLYGAQLLSFIPKGEKDLLYFSPISKYTPGKALRGGVPLCWPWFGPIQSPQHGHARINLWKLIENVSTSPNDAKAVFEFEFNDIKALVTFEFTPRGFSQSLFTQNNSKSEIQLTEACHSYWNVGDIKKVTVKGLENIPFTENSPSPNPHNENPLQIHGFIDRIYYPTTTPIQIEDESFNRTITIERSGSNSVIVWNIWAEGAEKMSDLPNNGWENYICIEVANAGKDIISLPSGSSHTLSYSVKL